MGKPTNYIAVNKNTSFSELLQNDKKKSEVQKNNRKIGKTYNSNMIQPRYFLICEQDKLYIVKPTTITVLLKNN